MTTPHLLQQGGRVSRALRRVALPTAAVLLTCSACTNSTPSGNSAPPAAASSGAASLRDPLFPGLGNGGYDVSHYVLTLAYQPEANTLKATAVITARATQALSSFNLDLHGLSVRNTTVNERVARTERRGDELVVTPSAPVGRGQEFTTAVSYDGLPATIEGEDGSIEGWMETDDGAVGLGEPTGSTAWFPGNHHPSDKASYDITITVPAELKAISNGTLKRRTEEGGLATYAWKNPEPMPSYAATVAVGVFDISETTTGGLPVYVATDPDEADKAQDMPSLIGEMTAWSVSRFGPYPFASTGAIVDHFPELDYALETQTKPYFQKAPGDGLVLHEIAHQWFGNSVTPRSWKDMWLNEGFATYAEWLWEEEQGGESARETFDAFYSGTHPESKGIWDFPPADPPDAGHVSDPPVYGRGALALHKVREAVGDNTFFSILKTWAERHRHKNADTSQFIKLCEEMSAKDLRGLFDAWLFGEGKPPNAPA
ncbi:M1 family metallopeptidase [Streptomyces sp. NPDC059909]|uniref:M1 family metallopeptidase n=1 Tax=Streptomyces sp. NPDC059909 TaxID=3346998 RepID=UPI00365DBC21